MLPQDQRNERFSRQGTDLELPGRYLDYKGATKCKLYREGIGKPRTHKHLDRLDKHLEQQYSSLGSTGV